MTSDYFEGVKERFKLYAPRFIWTGVGLLAIFVGLGLFEGDNFRVLTCKSRAKYIAYKTDSGRLYEYDEFEEAWVPKKLTEYNSKNSGGAYFKSSSSEDIKLNSVFVNGNLKIKKVIRKRGSMYGLNSTGMGSVTDYTDNEVTVVYDAKKEKETYTVSENGKQYTCKLNREKIYTPLVKRYRAVPPKTYSY